MDRTDYGILRKTEKIQRKLLEINNDCFEIQDLIDLREKAKKINFVDKNKKNNTKKQKSKNTKKSKKR